MERLHISIDGQTMGPFTLEQVRSVVGSDSAKAANTLVWLEAAKAWVPASQCPGLLEVAPSPIKSERKCLACITVIGVDDSLHVCERCSSGYHRRCWEAIGACTAPNCTIVRVSIEGDSVSEQSSNPDETSDHSVMSPGSVSNRMEKDWGLFKRWAIKGSRKLIRRLRRRSKKSTGDLVDSIVGINSSLTLASFVKPRVFVALFAVIFIVGLFFRFYFGTLTGFRIVLKEFPSFEDTIMDTSVLDGMPRIVAIFKHPSVVRQLEHMRVIRSQADIDWEAPLCQQ